VRADWVSMAGEATTENAEATLVRAADGAITLQLGGVWQLRHGIAAKAAAIERDLTHGDKPGRLGFDAQRLTSWDSALVTFLAGIEDFCGTHGITIDRAGLPEGARQLLELAAAAPPQSTAAAPRARPPILLARAGAAVLRVASTGGSALEFVGAIALALGRFARGEARYRKVDVVTLIQACGADALMIVALISFLVGVILAFMGAVQLEQFGASIYVADLVAIGITREMGAMMTAIIMAGRTGAAFAAQLGTMKVRQEIEALETMGISPVEFLVVPRVIALVLMMPLLCLYADFIGIFGGATIGVGMLHLSFTTYLKESAKAIYPTGVMGGLFKSLVYGILIAIAGCYQGMKCGNSASAVGECTTAAVVDGIILVVVACGLFALVFNVIGI
jgi:phospholipid/cholesterol/gamma-HCH transport system permease protein